MTSLFENSENINYGQVCKVTILEDKTNSKKFCW